jgi:drug/metabolite transporter (DMT)-like permease
LIRVWTALAAVYVLWGTTFFAIKIGIGAIPPLLLVGSRFVVAGAIVCIWRGFAGAAHDLKPAHWLWATLIGTSMVLLGNGAVAWSERTVPTGVVAIMVATVPLWLVVIDAALKRRAPSPRILIGIVLGVFGVALVAGFRGVQQIDVTGLLVVLGGSLMWAFGSIASRGAALPRDAFLTGGMEMLTGGLIALGAAAITGELSASGLIFSQWTHTWTQSALAWVYLVLAGSVVGFNAYTWLLRSASAAIVGTYAFVNPVIAFGLGWAMLGERAGIGVFIGAVSIVVSVAIIAWPRSARISNPGFTQRRAA